MLDNRRDLENDESVLLADLPIIDAHHHLYERPNLRYLIDDYLADTRQGHQIDASVYVEAGAVRHEAGPEHLRPLAEIEFAENLARTCARTDQSRCKVGAAIIGFSDLRSGPVVGEFLDRACELSGRFRGVRQITIAHPDRTVLRHLAHHPEDGIIEAPGFLQGARELASRDLVFEATVLHHQLPGLARLARAVPDLKINLCHMGLALARESSEMARSEAFGEWRQELARLAVFPNVFCKISGLGTSYWGFALEDREVRPDYSLLAKLWRPYVETTIEVFGLDRCMVGSNFPNDGRSCDFAALWNALKTIALQYSPDERTRLFSGTAGQRYQIAQLD